MVLQLAITLPLRRAAGPAAARQAGAQLVANVSEIGSFTYSMVPANGQERVFLVLEHLNNQEAIVRQQQLALDARTAAAAAAEVRRSSHRATTR